MKFALTTDDNHTIVKEYLRFESLLPLKFIIRSIFMKQHTLLFENIESADIS
jgi:hypothetical protein